MSRTLELQHFIQSGKDRKAEIIGHQWDKFNHSRQPWLDEQQEVRNFLFATDTSTTSNSTLPWKNSTTLPKLTQIRDNLHANYLSTIMPNDRWLKWEGKGNEDSTKEKAQAIQGYMDNKLKEGEARQVISDLLLDFIDTGNAFAQPKFKEEFHVDPETDEKIPGFIGPKMERISPQDIVFDPTAATWDDTPVVIRRLLTLGDLEVLAEDYPADEQLQDAVSRAKALRGRRSEFSEEDWRKQEALLVDGFGSLFDYLQSGNVEVLEFQGDLYDETSETLLRNMKITVIDRAFVLSEEKLSNWFGKKEVFHVGWRSRPDNLYGMGPLNNLVGMQYRIDHLENLKADVFDLIAFPPIKIIGEVEDFDWGPLERIFINETDGDVQMLVPDTQALNADTQIQLLEERMEVYAGAPRQAMGFRTPGEKTAFEVQALEQAAGRIFQEKITLFETQLLEPTLNMMFEMARRNMRSSDIIRVMDDDFGVSQFLEVTKADITASGKIRPIGARHFAQNAQLVQNLQNLLGGPMAQLVQQHLSTKRLASLMEELIGVQPFDLFSPNVAVEEQAETQQLAAQAQEEIRNVQGENVEDLQRQAAASQGGQNNAG